MHYVMCTASWASRRGAHLPLVDPIRRGVRHSELRDVHEHLVPTVGVTVGNFLGRALMHALRHELTALELLIFETIVVWKVALKARWGGW